MNDLYRRIATGVALGAGAFLLFTVPHWLFTCIAIAILFRILVFEWPRLFKSNEILFWILAPLYPILPIGLIFYLQLHGYELLNLILFSLVSAHDIGAFFFGKEWGITPISPSISPGKTWQGFAGGLLTSTMVSLVFFGHNSAENLIKTIFPFVLSINFAALAGDLFESALKRRAGRKDAGTMLPGHGGVLDRIDGVLFAVWVIFIGRNWLQKFLP